MVSLRSYASSFFFFFNDTATTEIYTLSLHDALPICTGAIAWPPSSFMINHIQWAGYGAALAAFGLVLIWQGKDRKSTRLNSSHGYISYAVFCLKKKKRTNTADYHPS